MIAAVVLFSVAYTPGRAPATAEDRIWNIMDRIAWKESRRRQDRIGIFGEVSEFQLMPATVRAYNSAHGTAYEVEAVRDSRILSRMIATWALSWHLWRYRRRPAPIRWILAVSAYHTGYRLADRGIVRWVYVDDVIPEDLEEVRARYRCRIGREYMKIGEARESKYNMRPFTLCEAHIPEWKKEYRIKYPDHVKE